MIYTFRIHITSDEVLKFYKKEIRAVSVVTEQGIRLQFPFHHLRPFVASFGVKGRFRVILDSDNRISRIEQIS
jgi:hypothetical protein